MTKAPRVQAQSWFSIKTRYKVPVIVSNFLSRREPFTPVLSIDKINHLSVLYFTDPLSLFICYLSTPASGVLPTKQQDNE